MSYPIGVSFFKERLDTPIVLGPGLNFTVGLAGSNSDRVRAGYAGITNHVVKDGGFGNTVDLETKFSHVDNQSITCI